ncbi:MAG TPA: winged helix-turn-helix domain-containing protein [Terriglobales bacterium]|nr:winged helix-turn-helix domain-containing protein [Terriglobales bacterium]
MNQGFSILCFGEYEADLRSGELRRQGHRLKLQEKPFQVLAALLQRPGELVTREELRQSLWPADTFVDFEHGLNTAVNKVREVLRDSANNPRFIETLPRRGYRFIGAVSNNSGVGVVANKTDKAETQSPAADISTLEAELPKAPRSTARLLLLLIESGYLISYIAALHYLLWVRMLARFSFGPVQAITITSSIILWCAMGVPMRFYLVFALLFDYHLLKEKFRRLFPFLLVIDEFWSGMTLFLVPTIGLGFGFLLFVAAVYSPFAQRTLVRMAYDNHLR